MAIGYYVKCKKNNDLKCFSIFYDTNKDEMMITFLFMNN